jgi:hypothetical protein
MMSSIVEAGDAVQTASSFDGETEFVAITEKGVDLLCLIARLDPSRKIPIE